MTYILSFIVAFGTAAIAGLVLVPMLRRLKAGQMIREDGPTWHMSKQGTPSMGGLMFILGILIAVLVAGAEYLKAGNSAHIVVFLFALVFGIIGFIMNLLSTAAFIWPATALYKRRHSLRGAVAGLAVGVILMTVLMLLWNYFITP